MSEVSEILLSGSTSGKQIQVTGTTTGASVTIHTAHATSLDNIWLYADNDSASDILLTLEWGGTTDITNTIKKTIPGRGKIGDGPVLVIDGRPLTGSLVVTAFAASANNIKISGHVLRKS